MSESKYFELRPHADGDGWTLLQGGIAIAGGSVKTCLCVLESAVSVILLRTVDAASDGVLSAPTGNQIEASYGKGIQVKDMDAHDVADAILRAQPKPFVAGSHKICLTCERILPADWPTSICEECEK